MRGRAWRVGTKITTASLACPPEHFYRKPMLVFWEKLGTAMRQVRNFPGNSHENVLEQPMLAITNAIRKISEMYPFDPPIKQETFSKKLQELV